MKLNLSAEVSAARAAGQALVALESSVLAQGLPSPHNAEAARRCEAAVRAAGAVPATIAVLDGALWVGLSPEQTARLTEGQKLHKLGSRDLGVAMAQRLTGGTTVSATAELAAAAGIRLFATGGIGGVHRGAAASFDVSTDLQVLSRSPVAVVCAGAKSVLDVPATLEVLETLGVCVVGYGTDDFPGFYSCRSGLPLEHQVDGPLAAAAVVRNRFDELGQGGVLFAVPPPQATEIPRAEIDAVIDLALAEAARLKIVGKAVTPFLLGQLAQRLPGRALAANLALLENNARVAAQIAVALAGLKG